MFLILDVKEGSFLNLYAIPIANGVLPRPDGGILNGAFLEPIFAKMLINTGVGNEIFIFPVSSEDETFYPVGVVVRIEDMWTGKLSEQGAEILFAKVIGRERYKAQSFDFSDDGLVASGLKRFYSSQMREMGYPVICGAGWYPTGGYTTFGTDRNNIEITIYGFEFEKGGDVSITARISGEIEPEKAHTIEHAIIRSLKNYAMCTPKTLRSCIIKETEELKWSVEVGIAKKLPEIFGVTKSGMCGNPLTQMASYHLSDELKKQIQSGENIIKSIENARTKTVSKITREMDISTQKGIRQLQGLKKGMFHDDTPEELKTLKKVIMKFPQDPWR